MASELRVDKIIPTTGVPTNGTGGVIQTVYSQFKSPATASTTSTSFVDTGISATITPKFATSKIFIHVNFFYWFASATETEYCVATIYRDSTNLAIGDLGSNRIGSGGSGSTNSLQWYQSGDPMATFNNGVSLSFIDGAHNSTSALTYKLYLRQNTNEAGGTLYYGWIQQVNLFMLQELSA